MINVSQFQFLLKLVTDFLCLLCDFIKHKMRCYNHQCDTVGGPSLTITIAIHFVTMDDITMATDKQTNI